MERGLLWTPLLILFFWLAWAGWNEYQKLEAYKVWAQSFERSKYDILAALGQSGDTLTWGKPTRSGPVNLQQIERQQISSIQLWVDGREASPELKDKPGKKAHIALQLTDPAIDSPALVPFTDLQLAAQWVEFLQKWLKGEAEDLRVGAPPSATDISVASDSSDSQNG